MAAPSVDVPGVALLGATGQIGFELRTALAGLGESWCPPRRELDLADEKACERALMARAPRYIVNAAAYTAVDDAEAEPEEAHALNARAPAVLARCASRLDAVLVHYSTDYVFDGEGNRAYREQDPPSPLGIYGLSKLEGERAILDSGAAALIFRTSWIYGQRGSNFLLTVRRLAQQREHLRIVADQIGSPTWCRAVARASAHVLASLGDSPLEGLAGRQGVYHMSAAGQTSWHGFARAVIALDPALSRRRDVRVEAIGTSDYPTAARRPAYSVLDNSRLRESFGVSLAHWHDSLVQALALREDGLDTLA